MNSHEKSLEEYAAAARGDVEIHVWKGKLSPYMKTTVVKPGDEVSSDSGLPKDFVESQEISYIGIMTREEAQKRYQDLQSYSE